MGTKKSSLTRQDHNTPARISHAKTGDTHPFQEPEDPVDRLLSRDPKLVRLNTLIRRYQIELRTLCSEEAWRQYLRIEELINERMFSLADLLLKQPR
jgi:hypothetical protein